MSIDYDNFQNLQILGQKIRRLGIILIIFNTLLFIGTQFILFNSTADIVDGILVYSNLYALKAARIMLYNLQWVSFFYFIFIKYYTISFIIQLRKTDLKFAKGQDNSSKIVRLFIIGILIESIVIVLGFFRIHSFLFRLYSDEYSYMFNNFNPYLILSDLKRTFLFVNFFSLIPIIFRMIALNLLNKDLDYLPRNGQYQNKLAKKEISIGIKSAIFGEIPLLLAEVLFFFIPLQIIFEIIKWVGGLFIIGGFVNVGNGIKKYIFVSPTPHSNVPHD